MGYELVRLISTTMREGKGKERNFQVLSLRYDTGVGRKAGFGVQGRLGRRRDNT